MAQDAWLVKVPRFLAERWADHAAKGGKGTELGRMRVYDACVLHSSPFEASVAQTGTSRDANGKRKIELVVPSGPGLSSVPANYKVDIRNPNANRMYILDELAQPQVIGTEKFEEEGASTSNGAQRGKRRAKLARAEPPFITSVRAGC